MGGAVHVAVPVFRLHPRRRIVALNRLIQAICTFSASDHECYFAVCRDSHIQSLVKP
jgi:hypothetical protein